MRTLSSVITTELESSEFRLFYLLDIAIGASIYRFTNCDIPLVVSGNRYDPRGFEAESVRYSSQNIVDELKLSIENLNDIFTLDFVGGTPRGSTVIYSFVLVDSNYNIITEQAIPDSTTTYWEEHPTSLGLIPVTAIGETTILGLWEYVAATGGLIPIVAIVGDDDFWEYDAGTGGLKPKA